MTQARLEFSRRDHPWILFIPLEKIGVTADDVIGVVSSGHVDHVAVVPMRGPFADRRRDQHIRIEHSQVEFLNAQPEVVGVEVTGSGDVSDWKIRIDAGYSHQSSSLPSDAVIRRRGADPRP